MMKSNKTLLSQQLKVTLVMTERKQQDNVPKKIRKDKKHKANLEEIRILLEDNKVMADTIAEDK